MASTPEADPLQAALEEAESLMESLGGTASQDGIPKGGFSIDSDDEGEHEDIPLIDTQKEDDEKELEESADIHPLHEAFLQDPLAAPPPPEQRRPTTTTSSNSSSPHGTTKTTAGGQGFSQQPPSLNGQSLGPSPTLSTTPLSDAATPSLDVFKAQTSRFASNLAHMAQRGFTQVASAATAATTTTTSTTTPGQHGQHGPHGISSPFGNMVSNVMSTPSMMADISAGSTTTPQQQHATLLHHSHSLPNDMTSTTPKATVQHQQQHLELDSEQKATLIRTHVGELLPGERVIMFLTNLLHVSDSTGFSYNSSSSSSSSTSPVNSQQQQQKQQMWCCAMTYYRLILFATHPGSIEPRPVGWNSACWPSTTSNTLQMPLASMDRVEKSVFAGGSTTSMMGLVIHGKDNGRQLRFTTPSYADTLRAHEALQTYAFPGRRNLGYLFAFESKRESVMASIVADPDTGNKTVTLEPVPKRFDGLQEFARQMKKDQTNVATATTGTPPRQHPWAIWTNINQSYQTCSSYPNLLVGPTSLDENSPDAQRIIRQCAAFRSENRLPALSWTTGVDGASLWRCSQPKIGLQGNRSSADELFLKHIMESSAAANAVASNTANHQPIVSRSMIVQLTGSPEIQNWTPEPGCGLKILDLRPRSAAMANRTGGYGYENTSNYPGTTLQFCNIGNIHAVRDSYQKVSAMANSPTTSDLQWNTAVEDTKWLSHIRLILAAAWETAFWIHVHRLPVLLHCSHGWDRTSQVAVLAQLLLDPYYRTRIGFSVLVEKDFLSFGHPFHTRCSHGEGRGGNEATSNGGGSSDEGQISPIFIQFLDCVFQIVQQYPECFEFNTKYLLIITEHIYSCRFGNFLCDTERERELVASIRQRTHSLWDYLDSREDTRNPRYRSDEGGAMLMPLATLLRNVTLWVDRHCMHGPKPTLRWLPATVQRPENPMASDQQSSLITFEENQTLLLSTLTTANTDKEEKPEAASEPEENSFTIN